jgi:hypothetical protein
MSEIPAAAREEAEGVGKGPERMRCLSIDMPVSLHRRFKAACAAADKLMVEEVLALIERRTAELERG